MCTYLCICVFIYTSIYAYIHLSIYPHLYLSTHIYISIYLSVCRFPRSDTAAEQSFPMTVTVSYIFKYHQDLIGYQPPAPPLLFEVPWDVFYPFVSSSASSNPISSTSSTTHVLITVLVFLSITLHIVIGA